MSKTSTSAWPLLLSAEQAAAYLGMSVRTLARLREEQEVAPRKVRGLIRYFRPDLDDLAASLPEADQP